MNARAFSQLVRKPLAISSLVFISLVMLVGLLSYQRYMLFKSERIRELTAVANATKEKLETALRNSLSATRTLNYLVAKDMADKDFNEEAKKILEDNKFVDAVELVQGGTITNVYPLEGNEAAIGYDILKDPQTSKEALKAAEENKLFFAGPIMLKQGYRAIVGRLPVFKEGKFWGFSAVIIKLSTLITVAEIDSSHSQPYSFQLSKINPNTGLEEFFLPHPEQFQKEDAVTVYLPDGDWKIYARITGDSMIGLVPFIVLGLLLSITGGVFTWYLLKRPEDLKKLVEEKTLLLSRSEEKFRSLVEQNLVGVFILQKNYFTYVNPGFEKMTGYKRDQLLNDVKFGDLVHEEDIDTIKREYPSDDDKMQATRQFVFKAIRRDKTIFHLEVTVSPIMYEGASSLIGTAVDITDRVEEEKRISVAVTNAQEKERLQIGMELHDNVKQIIAASLIRIEMARQNLDNRDKAIDALNKSKEYIREAINEIRYLSHRLAPSMDTDETLKEKIEKLIRNMNRDSPLQIELNVQTDDKPIHTDIQLAVYRILQEQFDNILKHAHASSVLISIQTENDTMEFSIKDDGRGFDSTIKNDGIGLENIKRRVHALNGHVKILSSHGNGCEIIIQIPLQRAYNQVY